MPVYDETYWREQEEYNRQCEQEYERQAANYYFGLYEQEQMMLEEADKRKYPLFFLKEGIVCYI